MEVPIVISEAMKVLAESLDPAMSFSEYRNRRTAEEIKAAEEKALDQLRADVPIVGKIVERIEGDDSDNLIIIFTDGSSIDIGGCIEGGFCVDYKPALG